MRMLSSRPLNTLSFLSLALHALDISGVGAQGLDSDTMNAHLTSGAGLLGTFQSSDAELASWMSKFDDDTPIQSLSIPATHDTLAWNVPGISGAFVNTQSTPLFDQLDAGVRLLDLRIGIVDSIIRLYHGSTQLDATAQLEDIFWGVYHWLDAHPTETILISVKVDNGENTQELQQTVYNLITGDGVADYWVQSDRLPTLGAARKKAILVSRMSFESLGITPVGINLSSGFADNNPAFTIDYTGTGENIAYIEDFYDVGQSDVALAVEAKFGAVSAHVDLAAGSDASGQLVITFASGYSQPFVTPRLLALGNATVPGVNNRTIDYLAEKKGQRFGVVLYDFYGTDARLGPATLGWDVEAEDSTNPPTTTRNSSNNDKGSSTLTVAPSISWIASMAAFLVAYL